MLVLSRKANQSIMIGSDIRILVVGVERDQVKLGIEAPKDVPVHRFEVFADIHRSQEAPNRTGADLRPADGDADPKGIASRGYEC